MVGRSKSRSIETIAFGILELIPIIPYNQSFLNLEYRIDRDFVSAPPLEDNCNAWHEIARQTCLCRACGSYLPSYWSSWLLLPSPQESSRLPAPTRERTTHSSTTKSPIQDYSPTLQPTYDHEASFSKSLIEMGAGASKPGDASKQVFMRYRPVGSCLRAAQRLGWGAWRRKRFSQQHS